MKGRIKHCTRTWLPIAVLATTLGASAAQAAMSGERQRLCRDGRSTYSDYYGGTPTGDPAIPFAPYRIVIPNRGWNGKLLAYAHGTGSAIKLKAGMPVDVDGNPYLDPSTQIPLLGFTPLHNALPEIATNGLSLPLDPDAFEDELVCNRKYAAVVSDYKPDLEFLTSGKLGWIVEDGVRDIGGAMAQARRLLYATKRRPPARTILLGRSQGSLVALRYAEERSSLVDGVITACTVGAGTSRSWDTAVDAALAIDVAFSPTGNGTGGWPWGESPGNVGDIDDEVVFGSAANPAPGTVAETLGLWLNKDPVAFARLEFVRLVLGLPREGFYPFPAPAIPPFYGQSLGYPGFNWLGSILLFATEVKADLEIKAGGAVGQNSDHVYDLSDTDRAYLGALGLSENTTGTWLEEMNARTRYAPSPQGAHYSARFHDFAFDSRLPPRPMLSIHTTTDGLVLPSQETVLRETLDAAGGPAKRRQLLQKLVRSNGHCTLTQAEWELALDAMERRLDHGVWPGDRFFPNRPDHGLRFENDFDPGPFPQPPSP